MTKRDSVFFSSVLVFLIAFCSSAALAQSKAPADDYPMKKIKLGSGGRVTALRTWAITGKKSSVAFCTEYIESPREMKFKKFKLSHRGKASGISTLLQGIEGSIHDAGAVWISDTSNTSVSFSDGGHGLLFVSYSTDETREGVVVKVAKFDANGDLDNGFVKLLEITAPEGKDTRDADIGAAIGPNFVAVAVSFGYFNLSREMYGMDESEIYFFETDYNGNILGKMSNVPLPKGGKMNQFRAYSPAWNGKAWMVPLSNYRVRREVTNVEKNYGGPRPDGNDLFVFSAGSADTGSRKIRLKRIFKDTQDTYYTFRSLNFLPADLNAKAKASAKAKGQTLTLMVAHLKTVPDEQRTMDYYTADYFAQKINRKAKREGKSVPIRIPPWDHKMPYDPDKDLWSFSDLMSHSIPLKDGRHCWAQTRSTTLAKDTGNYNFVFDEEQEYNLYAFDPESGEVELLARGAGGRPGNYRRTVVRRFNNRVSVLNSFQPRERDKYPYEILFSSFKP